jgi:hypothetical protein
MLFSLAILTYDNSLSGAFLAVAKRSGRSPVLSVADMKDEVNGDRTTCPERAQRKYLDNQGHFVQF